MENRGISLVITSHIPEKLRDACKHKIVQFTGDMQKEEIKAACEMMGENDEVIVDMEQVPHAYNIPSCVPCPVYSIEWDMVYAWRHHPEDIDDVISGEDIDPDKDIITVRPIPKDGEVILKIKRYEGIKLIPPKVEIPIDKYMEILDLLSSSASTISETTSLLSPCNGVEDWSKYDISPNLNKMGEYLRKLI